jgi:non-specific protein-tyrosine kinase
MKIQKALEKAKMTRMERKGLDSRHQPAAARKLPVCKWESPKYCDSVQAKLDPDLLRSNRLVCIDQKVPELDFYKVLRTKIQQVARPKGWNTVMVTSPRQGDGKTTTTVNLALTFSNTYNQTVLLVDCDLRRQNIYSMLGIKSKAGLVDHLVDNTPLQDFIIWPGIQNLTLISGGRKVQNSAELLSSNRMKTLVNDMKKRYTDRYILIDAPPVLHGADTLALAPLMDCIVMVVSEGETSMREVKKAVDMLPREKLLGFVMNRQRVRNNSNGYYTYN